MADNKAFLKILSKLMDESPQPGPLTEIINNISKKINDELLPELNSSEHPTAPEMLQHLTELTAQLRTVSAFAGMIGQKTVYVSGCNKERAERIAELVTDGRTSLPVNAVKLGIPLILINGGNGDAIAVNYAGRRILLTPEECIDAVECSIRSKTDLAGVVKAFIIGVPPDIDRCIIIGNRDADTELFGRIITDIFAYTGDEQYKGELKKSTKYRGTLPKKEKDFIALSGKEGCSFLSFEDSFLSVLAELEVYYQSRISNTENSKRLITADIVREGAASSELETLRLEKNNEYNKLMKERDRLTSIFKDLQKHFKEADESLCSAAECSPPKYDIERVAERLFLYAEAGMIDRLEDIPLQLGRTGESLTRNVIKWLIAYTAAVKTGSQPSRVSLNASMLMPKKIDDWKLAKAYVALSDYDDDPLLSGQCVRAIEGSGRTLSTGKELYFKAMTASPAEMVNLLTESYKAGMTDAADDLWNLYKSNDLHIVKQDLAELQIKEFCVEVSEDQLESLSGNITLDSPLLLYLKYAAAQEYPPAIGLIVDSIYTSVFDPSFKAERDVSSVPFIRSEDKKALAEKLIALCRLLIDKGYKAMHFRGIAGLMQFLVKDYTASYKMLSGVSSKQAHYCKGYMCETGKGTAKSIDSAIEHYEKAGDAVNAIARAQKLRDKLEEDQEDDSLFDSSKSYKTETTYSSSSSGCFITTAACSALGKSSDCAELEAMRHFRDTQLVGDSEGELLAAEYYRTAPEIISRIDCLPDSEGIYRSLWDCYIQKCYELICAGQYDQAKHRYISMVIGLCRRFNISLKYGLYEKYGSVD